MSATEFRAAHLAHRDWRHVVDGCREQLGATPGGGLGILYVTDALAGDLPAMLPRLRESTGVEHWVGTVGFGVCASGREYFDQPAAAMLVASLPPEQFRVFASADAAGQDFRRDHGPWCERAGPCVALVHGDPRSPALLAQLRCVADAAGPGFLVGGVAASRGPLPQVADAVVEGGLSGVVLSRDVTVATRLTQGCVPIGPRREITACRRNVVQEIDGRPALEVFDEDAGELIARDRQRAAGFIHAALPLAGVDTGDYLVRNIVGLDVERRLVAISDVVEPGSAIVFCRRDAASALEDLGRMADRARGAVPAPRAALYHSCVARGPNLFGPGGHELGVLRERLGDVPLAGFFGNGEICNARLYAYTGVLTLFT